MSLVFSALTPHPPLLIPNIGKENISKLAATQKAMIDLEQHLYTTKPDTIIFITPHGQTFPESFTINTTPEYQFDFKDFGDLATTGKFKSDLNLISNIANAAKRQHQPLVLHSEKSLDYGTAIPLFYLSQHLPNIKIIPLSHSALGLKDHFDFGYFLKDVIMNSEKRIAVIASGDLSHRLSPNSPAGFSPLAKKFDDTLIETLKTGNISGLINLDETLRQEAEECGLKSLLILMGILRNMSYDLKLESYENPFGIGYLVANFSL
ncbi:MAG TPA: AmmeMemoRadiSam system protein B [Candidatus Magasanikbacteria bacterium]|nr:AmmeMemoRadiSam system protein B [Candidatus Magasanikbacteria bacterium]